MHDCTHTTDTDNKLARDLQQAFAPLLDATNRPPRLVLHSVCVEHDTVSALIELADAPDVTYQVVIPLSAPTAAMLSCVSGHQV
jgi:hypothetical protein